MCPSEDLRIWPKAIKCMYVHTMHTRAHTHAHTDIVQSGYIKKTPVPCLSKSQKAGLPSLCINYYGSWLVMISS